MRKRTQKKSQAAMEFLMTYGWAILAVLVIIGTLAYFGVLDPFGLLPEKCSLPAHLNCDDHIIGENEIRFSVKSSAKEITIKNVALESEAIEGGTCTKDVDIDVSKGIKNDIVLDPSAGCIYKDTGKGKNKYKVSVTYLFKGETFEHTLQGEIFARKENFGSSGSQQDPPRLFGITHAPESQDAEQPVIITSDASDPNSDLIRLYMCRDSSCSDCGIESTSNCWAIGTSSTENPTATYTCPNNPENNVVLYYGKVCDQTGLCSPVSNSNAFVCRAGDVPDDTNPPMTSISNVEGDSTDPYEDSNDDGNTDITISGEEGMICRHYNTDEGYSDSGNACSTAGDQASCIIATGSDGVYTAYVSCKDSIGNSQGSSDNLDVTWSLNTQVPDTTPPSTDILSAEDDTTQPYEDTSDDGNTDIIISGEPEMTCKLYDSDVAYSDSSGTECIISGNAATCTMATSAGTYTKHIACKDAAGNGQTSENNEDATWTVVTDSTAPVTSFLHQNTDSGRQVTLTCTDDVLCTGTNYCMDNNGACTPTTTYTAPFSTGANTHVRFFSTDSANIEPTKTVTIPSTTSATVISGNCDRETEITIACDATDPAASSSSLQVSLYAGQCTTTNCFETRSWATGTGTTYHNPGSMTYTSGSRFTKTLTVNQPVGTAIAATCQANNPQGAISNWGDAYPVCTVGGCTNPPTFDASASPDPAGLQTVTITFTASETLSTNPTVTVKPQGSSTEYPATFTSASGLNYQYSFTITSSHADGTAEIKITGTDTGSCSGSSLGTFEIDKAGPSGTITINNGDAATRYRDTTLSVSCTGCTHMQFSPDNIGWSEPQAFATTKSWYISGVDPVDAPHTVYAKFRDAAGNWGEPITDSIILDTTPVSLLVTSVEGDTTSPYQDTVNDGNTDIVVSGEAGMTCRINDFDGTVTGPSCTISGASATCTVTTASGSYTKHIFCSDYLGNAQNTAQNLDITWTVSTSTTPPTWGPGAYVLYEDQDPQIPGGIINIEGFARDTDSGDTLKIYVCRDSTCSNCGPSSQSNCFAFSSTAASGDASGYFKPTAAYTCPSTESGTRSYWAKICDSGGLCTPVDSGGSAFTCSADATAPTISLLSVSDDTTSPYYDWLWEDKEVIITVSAPTATNCYMYETDLSYHTDPARAYGVWPPRVVCNPLPVGKYSCSVSTISFIHGPVNRHIACKDSDSTPNFATSNLDVSLRVPYPPTLTSLTDNSEEVSPAPIGSSITFTGTAIADEGNQWKMLICKTNERLFGNCLRGTYCQSGFVNSGATATCSYSTQASDGPMQRWYGFACDVHGSCNERYNENSPFFVQNPWQRYTVFYQPGGAGSVEQDSASSTSLYAVNADNIFVAYNFNPSSGHPLLFSKSTNGGSTWTTPSTIDTTFVRGPVSIKAADSNNIFVAYSDDTSNLLKMAKSTNGGTSWTTSTVENTEGYYKSLQVVNANEIYIAYTKPGTNPSDTTIMLAKSTNGGGSWTKTDVYSSASSKYWPSLQVLGSNVFVSFYAEGSEKGIWFSKSTTGGSSWNSPVKLFTVPSEAIQSGKTSLHSPDGNTIYVAYSIDQGPGPSPFIPNWDQERLRSYIQVVKSTNGGASWSSNVTVDRSGDLGMVSHPSLYAKDSNTVYIAYYDDTWWSGESAGQRHQDLKFAESTNGGATWKTVTIDNFINGKSPSMQVVGSTVFISYFGRPNNIISGQQTAKVAKRP